MPSRARVGAAMPRPGTLLPMLARQGALPAHDEEWAFEVKWDGIRALAFCDGERATLMSRLNNDVTARYPELAGFGEAVGRRAILDGEIVAFDAKGRPSFQALQARMGLTTRAKVDHLLASVPVCFVLFDVLWLEDHATTSLPYLARRELLERLDVDEGGCWKVPPYRLGDGEGFLAATKEMGLEGVIAKRAASTYRPGVRSPDWLKIKNQRRQEFVVAGWTAGEGRRAGALGALLLGYWDEDAGKRRLRFAGKVGTGFDDATLDALAKKLAKIERKTSPFSDEVPKGARFAEPRLVCEVEFTEWTRDGTLRHPSFKGLRDDKDPDDVVREEGP